MTQGHGHCKADARFEATCSMFKMEIPSGDISPQVRGQHLRRRRQRRGKLAVDFVNALASMHFEKRCPWSEGMPEKTEKAL